MRNKKLYVIETCAHVDQRFLFSGHSAYNICTIGLAEDTSTFSGEISKRIFLESSSHNDAFSSITLTTCTHPPNISKVFYGYANNICQVLCTTYHLYPVFFSYRLAFRFFSLEDKILLIHYM